MTYVDWLIYKLIALVVLAFVWGLWRGITGKPLWLEPRDRQAARSRSDS
jgi:hypothetical protein